jgi:DNA-binding transcriptional LysR family regulator
MNEWSGDPSGSIKITCARYAARTILARVLPSFLLANPKICVEVRVDSRLTDLVRDGFDAGIRWGNIVPQDMVAVRVGASERLIVVGSPAYLERNPRPHVPADLDRHNCISYRLMSGGGFFPWKLESDGREVRVRAERQLIVDDPELATNLMLGGAGLGLILKPEAAPALAAGHLVRVLEDWCIPFDGQYLYYPSKQVTSALRALIDALKSQPGASADKDDHPPMNVANASL